MARRKLALALACTMIAALAGCSGSSVAVADGASPEEPSASRESTAVPGESDLRPGWRWESYRDVEIAVPATWTWSRADLTHSCGSGLGRKESAVGRPGVSPLSLCARDRPVTPDPNTLVEKNGSFVWFEDLKDWKSDGPEGERVVLRLGTAMILVQAEQPLRDQIAGSARRINVDANGCPVRHAVSDNPALRPSATTAVLNDVTAVSACRYALPDGPGTETRSGPTLTSSLHLDGREAERAVGAIANAPKGWGPDCADRKRPYYGHEMIVLRLTREKAEPAEIFLRYTGCSANGFDDGTTKRRLTKAASPFVSGPNHPAYYAGSDGKQEILN